MLNIISFENELPENKYLDFIIENYNYSTDSLILDYNYSYFKHYVSKDMCSFYKFYFVLTPDNKTIIASIVLTKENMYIDNNKTTLVSNNNEVKHYYYLNFACVHKDYRKNKLIEKLTYSIYYKYKNNNSLIYAITTKTCGRDEFNIIKQFKVYNLWNKQLSQNNKLLYNNKSKLYITNIEYIDPNVFYEKKFKYIMKSIKKNKDFNENSTNFRLSINYCKNLHSTNAIYHYLLLEDNSSFFNHKSKYIILYKLDLNCSSTNKIYDNYYITDSTQKLSCLEIEKIIEFLYKNNLKTNKQNVNHSKSEDDSIMINVPDFLLENEDQFSKLENITYQNINIAILSKNNNFNIQNVKFF